MSQEVLTDLGEFRAKETLADQALSTVTEMILGGELPLGSPVNEAELARTLNMSRGPVREAIRRLQGRNLVVRNSWQQARVIDFGLAEVVEIFELREGLEGTACRLATERMSDAALQQLEASLNPGLSAAERQPVDLHRIIAENCGNSRISGILYNDLYYLLRLYRKRAGELPGRRPRAKEEHWHIARAMLARDGALASSLMRAHIAHAIEHMRNTPAA